MNLLRRRASLRTYPRLLAAVALLTAGVAGATARTANTDAPRHARPETRLLAALEQWRSGHYGDALAELGALVDARPDFRLAQYLYGEALLARTGKAGTVEFADEGTRMREHALIVEARRRWSHRQAPPPASAVPAAVLRLAPRYRHLVVVDLARNRLYLFQNDDGEPRLIADFYASIGSGGIGKHFEGDMRTPVGVYHVTDFKSDASLPALYGDGAYTLSYPNAWDRFYGRTGDGIWIHGVPSDTYSRAPLASAGCVVVSNQALEVLGAHVRAGITPVVFTDDLRWITPRQAGRARSEILATLRAWQQSWEQVGSLSYLDFYADNFVSDQGLGKYQFSRFRREVNLSRSQVALRLNDVSVFRYPGEDRLVLVTFTGRYRSDEFEATAHTHQYWRRDPVQGWRIVLETHENQSAVERSQATR